MNILFLALPTSRVPRMNYIRDEQCSSYSVLNIHSSIKTSFMQ